MNIRFSVLELLAVRDFAGELMRSELYEKNFSVEVAVHNIEVQLLGVGCIEFPNGRWVCLRGDERRVIKLHVSRADTPWIHWLSDAGARLISARGGEDWRYQYLVSVEEKVRTKLLERGAIETGNGWEFTNAEEEADAVEL